MDYSVADTTPQHPANRLDDIRSGLAGQSAPALPAEPLPPGGGHSRRREGGVASGRKPERSLLHLATALLRTSSVYHPDKECRRIPPWRIAGALRSPRAGKCS